jgi:hypothetical protein
MPYEATFLAGIPTITAFSEQLERTTALVPIVDSLPMCMAPIICAPA